MQEKSFVMNILNPAVNIDDYSSNITFRANNFNEIIAIKLNIDLRLAFDTRFRKTYDTWYE